MNAIILAAGKGTRMKSDLPKCAYPFCGKPMVNYIIESCKEAGVENIVCVVGYKKEDLIKVLPEDVKYVYIGNFEYDLDYALRVVEFNHYDEYSLAQKELNRAMGKEVDLVRGRISFPEK